MEHFDGHKLLSSTGPILLLTVPNIELEKSLAFEKKIAHKGFRSTSFEECHNLSSVVEVHTKPNTCHIFIASSGSCFSTLKLLKSSPNEAGNVTSF